MSADLLLSRLDRVRRTGPGRWVARCPAHKDRTASLSIRELDDGRVLVHDFAGCDVEAVLAAVGLHLVDLYPPLPIGPGAGRKGEKRPFSARDLLNALAAELNVVWVVLGDVAASREMGPKDRKRAGIARERCMALIEELRHAG